MKQSNLSNMIHVVSISFPSPVWWTYTKTCSVISVVPCDRPTGNHPYHEHQLTFLKLLLVSTTICSLVDQHYFLHFWLNISMYIYILWGSFVFDSVYTITAIINNINAIRHWIPSSTYRFICLSVHCHYNHRHLYVNGLWVHISINLPLIIIYTL